jgi:multiple sugar transport system substrate-binding protein
VALAMLVLGLLASACGSEPTATPVSATATTAPAAAAQPTNTASAAGATGATATTAGSGAQSNLSGTVNFFTFSAAPDHLTDLDNMIKAFQTANPGVKVNVQSAPFADYFTKLQTLIAGGQAPDVFELNYENFPTYASKGTLLDLTPLISADKSFDPKVFYPLAYQAFNLNGKQYGLSESFSDVLLFYNKDLFDKAGVSYPTADWTWDDALAAAKKLTNAQSGQWGLFKPIQFYEFYKTAYQFGCDFFNADKTATNINDPKCVQALQFMVDLVNKDHVMPTDAELGGVGDDALFKSGKLAMWVNGIWQFTPMKDAPFKWDVVVEPGKVRKGTHFFSNAVVVSKDTKNQDAAYAWLKFFTSSPDVANIRINSAWELPALNQPDLFKSYLSQTPPSNRQAVFDALNYIVTTPVIEKESEMQDAINKQLDKAKLGQVTPQQALDQAKQDVDALMK